MLLLLVWVKIDVVLKYMVTYSTKSKQNNHFFHLGWLSDSNNYGEYVRNCSIFVVPPNEQGAIKYANAGCAFPGWQWSHWLVKNLF